MALAGPVRRPLVLSLLTALSLAGCGAPKSRPMDSGEAEVERVPSTEPAGPSMWDADPAATPPSPAPPEASAETLEDGQRILGSTDYWLRVADLVAHPQGHLLYALSHGSVVEIDPKTGVEISETSIGGQLDDMVFLDAGHAVIARRNSSKVVFVTLLDLGDMSVLDERELDVVIRSGRPRLSPDGSLLATTSGEIPTRLWSVKTGKRLQSLGGRSFDHVDAMPVALAGGKTRVAGTSFKGLELYGESLSDPVAEQDWGHPHLYASPDGEQLIAVSASTVRVMSAEDGRKLGTYDTGLGEGQFDAVSPSGKKIVVSNEAGHAAVIDIVADTATALTIPNFGYLSAVAFVGEDTLASIDGTRALHITPIASPDQARGPRGHGGQVSWVRFLDDTRILSWGQDRRYRLWDPMTGRHLGIVGTELVAIDPAGQWFATGPSDALVVRDREGEPLATPPALASLAGQEDMLTRRDGLQRPRWSGDGSRATLLGSHDVHVVDTSGEVVHSWPFTGDHTFEALPGMVAPSGERAAIWDQDGALMLVDVKRNKATDRVGMGDCKLPVLAVFVDYGKGMRFLALEAEGTFAEYDARTGKLLRSGALDLVSSIPKDMGLPHNDIRATADGMIYFTIIDQGLFRLDLKGNTITRLLSRDDSRQGWSGLDISPSGKQVALGRWTDGTVELWDRAKLDARPGATADLAIDTEAREVCELIEPEPEPEPESDF